MKAKPKRPSSSTPTRQITSADLARMYDMAEQMHATGACGEDFLVLLYADCPEAEAVRLRGRALEFREAFAVGLEAIRLAGRNAVVVTVEDGKDEPSQGWFNTQVYAVGERHLLNTRDASLTGASLAEQSKTMSVRLVELAGNLVQ